MTSHRPNTTLNDLGDTEGFDQPGEEDELYLLHFKDNVYRRVLLSDFKEPKWLINLTIASPYITLDKDRNIG